MNISPESDLSMPSWSSKNTTPSLAKQCASV